METFGNQNLPKNCSKFFCNFCNYGTCKKSSFDDHLLTAKHKKHTNGNILETFVNKNLPKTCSIFFTCKNCCKNFKNRSGLWKHNKKCSEESIFINMKQNTEDVETNDLVLNKELIMMILKQNQDILKENSELKNMMIDAQTQMFKVIENGTHNTTNSHNKTFNLNMFLNETCKDAMNINEFVDSLQLQLSDLEKVGELGYIEGISNIIIKNLNAMDVTLRPVHCTDKKRETMYIKDEDKWEKEDLNKGKLHKMVRKVANKNIHLIQNFKEKYPDCIKSSSRHSDKYNKIIVESMGGMGDNDHEKEEKIIKKIAKEVLIDKSL